MVLHHRPRVFLLTLGLVAASPLVGAQVSTTPLEQRSEAPRPASPAGRQTGVVTLDRDDGQQIIIQSYEPRQVASAQYRIDFEALDTDGDGHISRAEARAHPTLDTEFAAIDVNRDGRLSREELAGWVR